MNYMIAILPKMAGFLLLVLIGFTASRIGVIKKEAMSSISGFLLKIVLPALTISLIWENQTTFYTMNGPLWQNGHCTDSHVLHHGSRRYPWKQNLPLKRNNI